MKQAIATTAENVHAHRAAITVALLIGCAICALFYAVNLYSLISRTVAIRQAEGSAASLSSAISALDATYLKLTSAITPDTVSAHGLSVGQVSAYIKRSQSTASIMPALAQVGHEL
jgi:hypothetical protein